MELVELDETANKSLVRITIRERKFHQVKRMVAACGKEVTDLRRLRMGPLVLDEDLAIGAFRRLTQDELMSLEEFGVEV